MGFGVSINEVSFAGSVITIGDATIGDFMDDANPIECQDAETCNIEWSLNGRMIRTVKPSPVVISVSVIPGSPSDTSLHRIWKQSFPNGGSGMNLSACNKSLTCTIAPRAGLGKTYHFSGGTCLSGAPAVSVNAQGKMGGNTYTFAFSMVE